MVEKKCFYAKGKIKLFILDMAQFGLTEHSQQSNS